MTGVHIVLRDETGAFVDLACDRPDADVDSVVRQAKELLHFIREQRAASANDASSAPRHGDSSAEVKQSTSTWTPPTAQSAPMSQPPVVAQTPMPAPVPVELPRRQPQRIDETYVMPSVMREAPPQWTAPVDVTAPLQRIADE